MGHAGTDPEMPDDHAGRRTRGSAAYGMATGAAAAIVVIAAGADPEITAGVLIAWALQWPAVRALGAALDEGRDATRAWLGGLAVRGAGLAVAAGVMMAGRASEKLPIAYGAALILLLMAEALWLLRRLPAWPRRAKATPADDALEGTRGIG